jgi:hypothetical protein
MANFQQPAQSICWSACLVAGGADSGAPMSVESGDLSLVRRVQAGERAAYDLLVL